MSNCSEIVSTWVLRIIFLLRSHCAITPKFPRLFILFEPIHFKLDMLSMLLSQNHFPTKYVAFQRILEVTYFANLTTKISTMFYVWSNEAVTQCLKKLLKIFQAFQYLNQRRYFNFFLIDLAILLQNPVWVKKKMHCENCGSFLEILKFIFLKKANAFFLWFCSKFLTNMVDIPRKILSCVRVLEKRNFGFFL